MQMVLCCFFAAAAAYFVLTSLFAIANFGWRQPMFDQWHEYETYLGFPFPYDVIQEANGHRPILPNLLRVAEIQWLAGNQRLQLGVGTLAELLIIAVFIFASLRARILPPTARWASVLLGVLSVLWLANARRLLHGSEALHGYLPMLGAVLATCCTWLAYQRHSLTWVALASLSCILATFSFGLGLGSFCSVVLLGILLRLPWRWQAVPLGALAFSGVLYIYVLPGNQGVRGQLHIEPFEYLRQTARWVASPWMNGWLNSADPSVHVGDHGTLIGHFVNSSAKVVVEAVGVVGVTPDWIAALLGATGILAFAVLVLRFWVARRTPSQLESIAIGAATFGLASALITVLGRLDYLRVHPDQIYADRYLAWPSLFWASLAILLLTHIVQSGRRGWQTLGVMFLIALPIMLSATQRTGAIWGALVYRSAQKAAAQVRSGVYDHANFPGVDMGVEGELREIALLRDHRIAMFADPAWRRVGTKWTGAMSTEANLIAEAHWSDPVADPTIDAPVGHVEGWIKSGVREVGSRQLALLDGDQTIVGLAEFSFISPTSGSLLFSIPTKRGFDGYIRNYDPHQSYSLALLDFDENTAALLAILPAK